MESLSQSGSKIISQQELQEAKPSHTVDGKSVVKTILKNS